MELRRAIAAAGTAVVRLHEKSSAGRGSLLLARIVTR